MPPRVPEEEPEFIENVEQGDQNDPDPDEDLDAQFWMMVAEIYGNVDIVGPLAREFRERPEDNNTVVGVLLIGITVFYEHPQLVLFYNQLMGDDEHAIAIEQFGDRQDMRYVILPERIVAPVPQNADGTPRQMIGPH